MDVPYLVFEFLLFCSDILMCLGSCKQVVKGFLVFLLVLVGLLGAWQLLDEEDVYYLNEFVFNQLIVQDVQDF